MGDHSIRIFYKNNGHSREIYTTRRMQHVEAIKFSIDGEYIFSGSNDMNVRIWKTERSKPQRILLVREKRKKIYNDALIDRYQHLPELANIVNKRFLPKIIF